MRIVPLDDQRRTGSWRLVPMLLLVLLCWFSAPLHAQESSPLQEAYELLNTKSFKDKSRAVELIGNSGEELAEPLLRALMGGDLYFEEANNRYVVGKKQGKEYAISDPATGDSLGVVGRKAVSKVKTNNSVRGQIRGILATLTLKSPNADTRLRAVNELIDANDDDLGEVLRPLLETESSGKVSAALATAIALDDLQRGEADVRLAAVETLSGSLNQTVRNTLRRVANNENEDESLRTAADDALKSIAGKIEFYGHLETLFFGLSLGSVLVLAAIGLAITFGVMGVINMAHGEFIMMGAYTGYVVQLSCRITRYRSCLPFRWPLP